MAEPETGPKMRGAGYLKRLMFHIKRTIGTSDESTLAVYLGWPVRNLPSDVQQQAPPRPLLHSKVGVLPWHVLFGLVNAGESWRF